MAFHFLRLTECRKKIDGGLSSSVLEEEKLKKKNRKKLGETEGVPQAQIAQHAPGITPLNLQLLSEHVNDQKQQKKMLDGKIRQDNEGKQKTKWDEITCKLFAPLLTPTGRVYGHYGTVAQYLMLPGLKTTSTKNEYLWQLIRDFQSPSITQTSWPFFPPSFPLL